ncbi:uncharacterized protein LOC122508228 isoform X1 [Leptopilina heterotoma]|uniref:uncharacterized protein LOC122508228 isoform X1 n=2 Tax=Leptopilina heterotoma TaxID=63436 RepID=UPI001CA95C38|nr:uncharacterized protein LOC122508228 isoform X1 [Leptopilina heterotoma]
MKMSWLFGKKKHQKDSPPDTPEEATPVEQGDDFIFIERRNPGGSIGENDARGNNLYPSISGMPYYPPLQQNKIQQNPQIDSQPNYINGIPFKYSKDFERSILNDMDIDRLRVNEILNYIERIQNDDADYTFQVEKSVIAEMDCANN